MFPLLSNNSQINSLTLIKCNFTGRNKFENDIYTSVNALNKNIGTVFFEQISNITKTRPFKYIENVTTKNENFQMENSVSFHISSHKT